MLRKIPFHTAAAIMMVLLVAILPYHLLILTGVVSYDAVWGGRLENVAQMYRFETVSIIVNFLMLVVVATKASLIRFRIPGPLVTTSLWIMTGIYALNTVGNMVSKNILEAIIFAPMTFVAAILCARLAIEKTAAMRS